MKVAFYDIFGKETEMSCDKINYLFPNSGDVKFSGVLSDEFILNHKTYKVPDKPDFSLPVKYENLTIQIDALKFEFILLTGNISQESIVAYKDFYAELEMYFVNNEMSYENLRKAFDRNNDKALRLCSFNKKFSELLQDHNRDDILENIKSFPHIFHKPKLHLKQIEEVRPASIVTRIGSESIRHLASHSEHWKGVNAGGLVPERLLARILEDEYAIYENVAVKTLVNRLYEIEKKEKDDTIDCKMNFSLEESYSQGGERQNFFDALNFLFKGYDKSESSTTQKLIDETLDKIQKILDYLNRCRGTSLYRKINKEKDISGKLKKTNIFMMDNYYKKAYKLWELLGKKEEITEIKDKKNLEEEYFMYCQILLLFTLNYMGYKQVDKDCPVFSRLLFNNLEFSFGKWTLTLDSNKAHIFDGFIKVELSESVTILVSFKQSLPETAVYADYYAKKNGNQLIFSKKISPDEQKQLADKLVQFIEKKLQNTWKRDFLTTVANEMQKISIKITKILFVPWKYGIADDYSVAKETVDEILKNMPAGFDEYYILNISRPNELRSIENEELLKSLITYPLRNSESGDSTIGIIPLSMNDINSFRRLSKVIMKNMILTQKEMTICPQCGKKMNGNISQGYECQNSECGLGINYPSCPDCHKHYWYTSYIKPTVFNLDTDLYGMQLLLNENALGFKNITEMNDETPVCPYCGPHKSLVSDFKLHSYSELIKSKKIIYKQSSKPVVDTDETQQNQNRDLVSKKVEFVEPKISTTVSVKTISDDVQDISNEVVKCPFCNLNLRIDSNDLLVHHIFYKHQIQAKNLRYIKILGDMVRCENCKENISNVPNSKIMIHLNKQCPAQKKPTIVSFEMISTNNFSSTKVIQSLSVKKRKEVLMSNIKQHSAQFYYTCPYCKKEIQQVHKMNHERKCKKKLQ